MMLGIFLLACQSEEPPEKLEIKYDSPGMMTDERSVYPDSGMVEGSFTYTDSGFLGIDSLNRFYSAKYVLDGDTVLLFTTHDRTGAQYLKFMALMKEMDSVRTLPHGVEFDEGYGFVASLPGYGKIIVGLVNFRLVGMTGFDAARDTTFFTDWIKHLPLPPEYAPLEDTLTAEK